MATFNSRTITVKPFAKDTEEKTKLKADSLEALLVSANPIRGDYNLSDEDYAYIKAEREKIDRVVSDMMHHLSKRKK